MPNDRITDTSISRPSVRARASRDLGPVFLGHSPATRAAQDAIARASASSEPVLVIGAPGTGKRTVAEILHRFAHAEVPLTCVVPEPDGGELLGDFCYLSPVEQLDYEHQRQLRVQTQLGRVVLGTRLDPATARGRAQLSGRLVRWCPIHVRLPTLAERIEDLELLATALLARLPSARPVGGISDEVIDRLRGHQWPGNVTELEEVLASAVAVAEGPRLELGDLPVYLRQPVPETVAPDSPEQQFSLARAERAAIDRAMEAARGNKRRAARLLQIGKTTLYRRLREYEAQQEESERDGS